MVAFLVGVAVGVAGVKYGAAAVTYVRGKLGV